MDERDWRELYKAAVLEVDPDKLHERIQATERAIRVRRASRNGNIFQEELAAMESALSAMSVTKHERPHPALREIDPRKTI